MDNPVDILREYHQGVQKIFNLRRDMRIKERELDKMRSRYKHQAATLGMVNSIDREIDVIDNRISEACDEKNELLYTLYARVKNGMHAAEDEIYEIVLPYVEEMKNMKHPGKDSIEKVKFDDKIHRLFTDEDFALDGWFMLAIFSRELSNTVGSKEVDPSKSNIELTEDDYADESGAAQATIVKSLARNYWAYLANPTNHTLTTLQAGLTLVDEAYDYALSEISPLTKTVIKHSDEIRFNRYANTVDNALEELPRPYHLMHLASHLLRKEIYVLENPPTEDEDDEE